MGSDAGYGSSSYIARQVVNLEALVDGFLDTTHPALVRARNNQGSSRWTDLPGCAEFRDQYMA